MAGNDLFVNVVHGGRTKKAGFARATFTYATLLAKVEKQHGDAIHAKIASGSLELKYTDRNGLTVTLSDEVIARPCRTMLY